MDRSPSTATFFDAESRSANTIHTLIGPNGAGKSTFIALISGVCQRQEKTIDFARQDPCRATTIRGISPKRRSLRLFHNLRSFHCPAVMDRTVDLRLPPQHHSQQTGLFEDMIRTFGALRGTKRNCDATAQAARWLRYWSVEAVH